MKYKSITVGGTFDRLHLGHQTLLETALARADQVWLGITTDKFVIKYKNNHSLPNEIQSFEIRKKAVTDFLGSRISKIHIIPIDDAYGTTLIDSSLQAIVVSAQTKLVAQAINQKRLALGWSKLDVVIEPWVLADDGQPISSLKIRQGQIDRQGQLYALPKTWNVRYLPDKLRSKLQQPTGEFIAESLSPKAVELFIHKWIKDGSNHMVIAVGDAVSYELLNQGFVPDISIVDLRVNRKPVYKNVQEIGFSKNYVFKKAVNKAGTISYDSFSALSNLINYQAKPSILQIIGEEDLMTLLAIFLAPLDSLIVYGQPIIQDRGKIVVDQKGIVVVKVTEEKKLHSQKILDQFIHSSKV